MIFHHSKISFGFFRFTLFLLLFCFFVFFGGGGCKGGNRLCSFVGTQICRGTYSFCIGIQESNYFFRFSECQNYQVLSDANRKLTNDDTPLRCDNTLGPAWFRFQGDAGTKMPTSCTPPKKCGTHATGWLNGAHPDEYEGKVTRQVCFSWNSNCCKWSVNIQVQNCSEYYLYYISGTSSERPCKLGFCGTD